VKSLKLIPVILILLVQLTIAESYTSYESAELNIKISSGMDLTPTGPNPKILEAEAIVNLIPSEEENQEILNTDVHSSPQAQIDKQSNKVTFLWRDVFDDISYSIESDVKTKNMPLRIKQINLYPTSYQSKYDKYTQEEEYINLDSNIRSLADDIFKDQTDLFTAIHEAAQWVENNIEYRRTPETEEKNKRSSWVLQNKYGVCDELTNLFISILRVKKIPTKFISGVVYSSQKQEFENHGWAEVYFPDQGWLPFDLTYQQHGWIDITHIKLAEAEDSDISSIDYHWKSSDLDIEVSRLNTRAKIEELGDIMLTVLTTAVEPGRTKVGFGSYVPIKITIENPTSFYITPSISLTKAPQLTEKNRKTILLKPKETKSVYFTAKIPAKLNEDYMYKSGIETEVSFSKQASSMIEFSSDYDIMTQSEARAIIEEEIEKDEKGEFESINLDCTTERDTYYEDEKVNIFCVIKNRESNTKDLDLCLTNNCRGINLKANEEEIVNFETPATNTILITAENENQIKHSTISLNIVKQPNIVVKSIQPLVMDYNEEVDLKIEVESTIPAHDVIIYLGKQVILNTNLLQEKRIITTKVKGKNLISDITLKMEYTDSLGKEYTKTDKYLVTVRNKPWYVYLFGWIL
jgi:hypothetical protein